MKRRQFLATSALATVAAGIRVSQTVSAAESSDGSKPEFYEWRVYRLKEGASRDLLDSYLEKAAIPALNRLGCKPVGAFVESQPKEPALYLLVPYASLEAFASAESRLSADPEYLKAAEPYLQTPKTAPAFSRIDSSLLVAMAGMPRIDLPEYSREKKKRIFELRTYESYSEAKAIRKVEMFNAGEIQIMKEISLGPIFYGKAISGPNLPQITYMLSAEDADAHKKHWGGFGKHPLWKSLGSDPKYADTVSKIINKFLEPTGYSQI